MSAPRAPRTAPLTVVTGGGRGIGAAVVARLAAEGHDLVVCYRADRAAAEATAEAARQHGVRAVPVQVDVTDPDAVADLFAHAAGHGTVTGLVNNAGATRLVADLADTPAATIAEVVALNLTGALLCAREAVRVMRPGGRCGAGGVIVNISSGAATLGSPHEYVHYAAAKAGVDALTVGLAQEVGPLGIRVVGVAPGAVRTGIHADAGDPGRVDRIGALVPLGRAGEPADVAGVVAFLMGPDASYVTGTTLRVAGGR